MFATPPNPTEKPRAAPNRLPMLRRNLVALFDHLDGALRHAHCDHDLRHTEDFLRREGITPAPALAWLARHGGRCDCTVLERVEDSWLARG